MFVEDEETNFCDGKQHYLLPDSVKLFEDQSPSLSLHPWSSV